MTNCSTACIFLSLLCCFVTNGFAQPLASFAELEVILDDQIVLEDFEGISLHGGSSIDVPNPLNSVTILDLPFSWDIEPGVTYLSPDRLAMHAGFFGGDEDVYLRSFDGIEINFDSWQRAFGLNLIGSLPGLDYTVSVYDHNDELIEAYPHPSTGSSFVGYESQTRGISRVTITHPQLSFFGVNNVGFGVEYINCPADLNNDQTHNLADIFVFLGYFNDEDDRADLTDDGVYNLQDVFAYLDLFAVDCP